MQDHDFAPVRIEHSSNNNVLLVDSNQNLKLVESFLSGEDIIPSAFNIKVAYRDGVKKMLIARTSPYIYQKDLRSNILLYTESKMKNLGFTLDTIINQLKFNLSAEFTSADMQSLNNLQLYQIGILRVLWQKPDAMIIVSTNEYNREEQDDFHTNLQLLCSRLNIYLVLLTDSEDINTQIWGNHNNLSPFLKLVSEA